MTTFSATFDTKAFDAALRGISRVAQFQVLGRALRRSQQTMTKVAIQEVASELNVRSGTIRRAIDVRRVERYSLSAELRIRSIGAPLIGFAGTRQTRRGVSVQIKKNGTRKVIRSAFIATLRSGKRSVFQRRLNAAGGQVRRLPIDILFSTSVRQSLEDRLKQTRILSAGRETFVKEFSRELSRRIAAGVPL